MMDTRYKDFDQRVGRIDKQHRKIANGYESRVNPDGLIIARANRSFRGRRFPWKGIALFFVAFFVFKGFLLGQLGETAYTDRIAKLGNGSVIEQAGAYAFSADPLTRWIAEQFRIIVR